MESRPSRNVRRPFSRSSGRRPARRQLRIETLETRRVLAAEVEPNGTFATATPFTGTDTLTGRIQSQTDVDHFSIAAQAGDELAFRFRGNGDSMPSFDATLEIINASGEVLASALDAHAISFQVARAGTYALRMTSNNVLGPVLNSYTVQATVTAFRGVSESESNNTPATANALNSQTNVRGSLTDTNDIDMFSIDLRAGQGITVKFTEQPINNPAVRLLSPTGEVLASGLNGLGLATTVSATGKYTISVAADNALRSMTGGYVAQVLLSDNATLQVDTGNEFQHATYVDMGPHVIPSQFLSSSSSFAAQGLTGSYINQSLRGSAAQSDWRTTQTVAGTRVDPTIHFTANGWGTRSVVGITGGSDDNWDNFSVQWDGFVRIVNAGTQLYLASDDGSRLWIDINGDGVFATTGSELINNNWGQGQGNTLSSPSVALAAGDYRIRIQYEEGGGGNAAYLLWSDRLNSAGGAATLNRAPPAIGSLASLADVDTYAVDLSGTGLYEFRLETVDGALGTQNRTLSLYNQYGQLLDYSHSGFISTTGWNTRVERSARYYLTVQATTATGLGAYELTTRVAGEFPRYRDVPLYFQNYSGYSKSAHVPAFLAFFESRYDIYQVDLTQTQPPATTEFVGWQFADTPGSGCGGAQGGWYGNRRPSGNGSGTCDANWTRLSDVWFGLFYHENGHGVGLFHARHPLNTMSYGGQYDFLPIGSFNWMGLNNTNGDARVSNTRLFNMRDYLDWALEAGRIVLESENNNTPARAQQITSYINEMTFDADARNDQAIVVASIASSDDIDHYQLTVGAGELYSFDIDSAEFQTALDATLEILDANGNVLASSTNSLDRNSGILSADPNLVHRFQAAGTYTLRVRPETFTSGYYRMKVSPERTLDATGPRIAGAWPDGGQTIDSTRQLTWWVNDQLDPATLTSDNIIVRGATSGVRSGKATFDSFTSVLTWVADADLPIDTYTVTLKSSITDLQGNLLDGETDGVLSFPEVSGNGSRGGDFVSTFVVNALDTRAAAVTGMNYYRQAHERDLLDIFVDDELDVTHANQATYTLRGAGPDATFGTADDTFAPVDVMYDPMMNLGGRLLRVYTRAMLSPDSYRIEASLRDATGKTVNLSQTFTVALAVPSAALSTTSAGSERGLVGSYVNRSLRSYATQDDWRVSQTIAGTRTDEMVDFTTDSFGVRSEVNITGGSDQNWDEFSVQWDGFIDIPANGTRLFTRSDDGSRMWIDINNDGVFATSGNELVNNNWGSGQGVTTGPASVPLNAGRYRIRMQYEEGGGGNRMSLLWDFPDARNTNDGMYSNLKVVDTSIQPNSVIDRSPTTVDVVFNGPVATNTLTPNSFRLIYSPDSDFFDDNDSLVTEANGQIQWNPTTRRASFEPATPLGTGYYMIELNGDAGGITSQGGRLLDGEYRDGYIVGGGTRQPWSDAPSGDGLPGGDYRAIFVITQPYASLNIIGDSSIAEAGGTATIEARLSFASIYPVTIELELSGQSAAATDYQINRTQIVIPAGSLSGTAQITALPDTIDEFDETIIVGIRNTSNATEDGTQTATLRILDDDLEPQIRLSLDVNTFSEASVSRILTATLSERSEKDAQVTLRFSGPAIPSADYLASSSTITIPAGSLTGSIQITSIQDTLDEPDEAIVMEIQTALNARDPGGQAQTLFLIDDDEAPTYALSLSRTSLLEAAGAANLVATLSTASGRSVVIPLVFSGTASTADYSGAATQLIIPAGATTAQLRLIATDDSLDEVDETIIVEAGSALNATSSTTQRVEATIVDDDLPPVVTLSASGSPMNEKNGQAVVSVTLSAPSSLPVTVDFGMVGGTAKQGTDYTASSTQIVIAPGQTSGSLTVNAVDDSSYERPETIVVAITQIRNASQPNAQQVALIINNDDAPPKATFALDNATPIEATSQVRLSATLDHASDVPVVIELTGDGTATLASDYTIASYSIEIAAGSLTGFVEINILQDGLDEPNESINFSITDSQDVDVAGVQVPGISIVDDDNASELTLLFETSSVPEANGEVFLVARLNQASGFDVRANLSWSGTAARDVDYSHAPAFVMIPAGLLEAKVLLTALPDELYEGQETIALTVASMEHANLVSPEPLMVNITDDDPVPVLAMTVDKLRVTESNTLILVSFQLSAPAGVPVTIDMQVEGSATADSDYRMPIQATLPPLTTQTDLRLDVLDDDIDESDESIVIRIGQLSGATSTAGAFTVMILDNESLELSVDTNSLSEAGGKTLATLRRTGTNLTQPLQLSLVASDPSQLSVPATVIIPADVASVSFEITANDDSLLDGTQSVTITASATNYQAATAIVEVLDAESLSLSFATVQIDEKGGTARVTLERSNTDVSNALTVQLVGLWTDLLRAQAAVVIPAGQSSQSFDVTAVDNFFLTGNRLADVRAEADGYASAAGQLEIVDDELLRPYRNPRNGLDVNKDGSVTAIDALLVINHLNTAGAGRLSPPPQLPFEPDLYLDTSEDDFVTSLDVLLVINYLNTRPAGEGDPLAQPGVDAVWALPSWRLAAPDPRDNDAVYRGRRNRV